MPMRSPTCAEDETVVLVEGMRPLVGQKLRWYRDKTFKPRRLQALPLPAPLEIELQDAPRVTIHHDSDRSGTARGGTVEQKPTHRQPTNH